MFTLLSCRFGSSVNSKILTAPRVARSERCSELSVLGSRGAVQAGVVGGHRAVGAPSSLAAGEMIPTGAFPHSGATFHR